MARSSSRCLIRRACGGWYRSSNDEPTAQAQAIMERVLRLVTECRSVLRALERPSEPGESSSAEAERILYYTLMSAIDAGLIKTMEDALQVLRHASQPLSDSEIGDSLD